ncbi:MAG TPA: hypothetical protein VFY29_12595 [Terriglobia bacterium]|nr:hypothetical protein [Terriglobia bacterium]
MTLSHFSALFIFSVAVSTVFALVTKNTPREQFRYGVRILIYFLGAAIILGWIMRPFPL